MIRRSQKPSERKLLRKRQACGVFVIRFLPFMNLYHPRNLGTTAIVGTFYVLAYIPFYSLTISSTPLSLVLIIDIIFYSIKSPLFTMLNYNSKQIGFIAYGANFWNGW